MFKEIAQYITHPGQVSQAKDIKAWKIIIYLLILSLLFTLPILFHIFSGYHSLDSAIQDIQEKTPPFTVQDGNLLVEDPIDSFVYQTDTFLYFFDPSGEMNRQVIDENIELGIAPIAIGFLEDELYVSTPINQAGLDFDQLEGLDHTILSDRFIGQFLGLLSLSLFLSVFVSTSAMSLLTALFAMFIVRINQKRYSFVQIWKVVLAASFLPYLTFAVLILFQILPIIALPILRILPLLITSYSTIKHG